RPRDGVHVGGQGLLHAAGHAPLAPAQRPGALRSDRRQSRPEATRFSRAGPAAIPAGPGPAVARHRAGHVQRREARRPAGTHPVRPWVAAAGRAPVRLRAENGISKIALGHHRDDIVETLFLNLFFGGRLKAMAPKLLSDDGRHVVIRPRAYVAERDIERYARGRAFPLIPCRLCGSQDHMQRLAVKKMLADWEREFPGRTESIFSALRNVEPE